MRILIDANLSPRIVPRIREQYPGAVHVFNTELLPDAPDIEIWNYAREHELPLVLSYDEDFRNLAERLGPPPRVVLLRLYDQRTATVVAFLQKHVSTIHDFLMDAEAEVLELRE